MTQEKTADTICQALKQLGIGHSRERAGAAILIRTGEAAITVERGGRVRLAQ